MVKTLSWELAGTFRDLFPSCTCFNRKERASYVRLASPFSKVLKDPLSQSSVTRLQCFRNKAVGKARKKAFGCAGDKTEKPWGSGELHWNHRPSQHPRAAHLQLHQKMWSCDSRQGNLGVFTSFTQPSGSSSEGTSHFKWNSKYPLDQQEVSRYAGRPVWKQSKELNTYSLHSFQYLAPVNLIPGVDSTSF